MWKSAILLLLPGHNTKCYQITQMNLQSDTFTVFDFLSTKVLLVTAEVALGWHSHIHFHNISLKISPFLYSWKCHQNVEILTNYLGRIIMIHKMAQNNSMPLQHCWHESDRSISSTAGFSCIVCYILSHQIGLSDNQGKWVPHIYKSVNNFEMDVMQPWHFLHSAFLTDIHIFWARFTKSSWIYFQYLHMYGLKQREDFLSPLWPCRELNERMGSIFCVQSFSFTGLLLNRKRLEILQNDSMVSISSYVCTKWTSYMFSIPKRMVSPCHLIAKLLSFHPFISAQ